MRAPLAGIPPREADQRPGVYAAALLFLYLFLVLTGYVATKSTRDALFIARFGAAALPYADVASAVGVVLAMALYLRLGRRLPLPHLQTGALAAFAAAAVGFWWAGRRLDSPWLLPVLYIWASVFGVLLPVQVWTLANHVITPRQAKRLFGVIGSGAISGCIAGGLLTRTVATRAGADTLLLVTAAALAAAIALVWAVWRTRPARPFATTAEWTSAGGAGLLAGFAQVRRRRYLSMLALMVTLSSIVTTIVAWQFRAVAGDAIRNTDDLAAFFGGFLFYAGLLSLATQLLVTGPLLRRVGLGSALLVLPIALAGGSAALALTGSLGAAVLLRGGDQVLRYAIDRPATEILYLPLPDAETFVAKSIIDTVLLRSGDCIGSLIVLAALALAVTPAGLGVVTLALGATWLAATRVVRREYVRTLQDNIRAHRLDAERLAEATASDRTAADAIAAIAALESRLADPDAAVRTEAFLALARLTDVDPLARLTDLDAVEDVSLHLSLVAYLSREGPQQNPTAARLLLDAAFAAASGSPEARLSLARALEVLPDETLEGFADAAVPLVGELLDARHAPALRRRAPGLLRRLGTPAADRTLVEHVTDPDPEVRREILLALNALRRLEPHRAIDRKLVETALAAEILGHYRSHQLLADAGVASGFSRTADGSDAGAENAVPIDLEGELERIFRMLKLLYPDHDLQSAYVGARSGNPGVHDHALEFLEHTLPPRLWDVLVPLLDHEANPDAPRALDAAIRRLARS
jgi:ATP/ADP translocase